MDSVVEAGKALRRGEVSSTELVSAALAAADAADAGLGVFLTRFPERALAAARRADLELASGVDRGPLHGIPLGVKDLITVAEGPTTAQSLVLGDGWGLGVDAAVTTRLREAGGVIVGKTTTMEFGCGVPDPGKPFPVPRNPWDTGRWAGGSSSGTASGIASGMFLAGLGTDTAGSIRMPAAFCGVTGLMPTYGLIPDDGVLPLARSLDRIGPLARTARDCAELLAVLDGTRSCAPAGHLRGLRVGVVRDWPGGADPALPAVFGAALSTVEELGARLVDVTLPYRAELTDAVLLTVAAEGLAQYRAELTARPDDFFVSTRGILEPGAVVSGADYVEAQRLRQRARQALAALFRTVDVVASPVAVIGAPRLDEVADAAGHLDSGLVARLCTPYWNGVGNPVLALPMGRTAGGLPLSLQLAAEPHGEATLLRMGEVFQRHTAWHEERVCR
ncbi:amidase [Amycolatopsis suaedae]|uniref:amidase n=1 Tax=Amycolatopsis suaedae TaxID=2510978 RepID=UPI0030B7F4F8